MQNPKVIKKFDMRESVIKVRNSSEAKSRATTGEVAGRCTTHACTTCCFKL